MHISSNEYILGLNCGAVWRCQELVHTDYTQFILLPAKESFVRTVLHPWRELVLSGFQASACFSNCALGPRCVPGLLSVDGRWKASAHALELPRSALQVSSCFGTPLKIISCFSLWVLLRTQITLLVWNLIWLTICIFLSLCFPLGIWTSLKFI